MEAIQQQQIYDNDREYFDQKPRNVSDSVKYPELHNLNIERQGDS